MATIDQTLGTPPEGENTPPVLATTPTPASAAPATTPAAPVQAPTTAPTALMAPATPAQDDKQKLAQMSYVDILNKFNPYTPPSDEQLEKEKKREKRQQIFAAIGDGISALSNLYFTTQGAPNMYTGKHTMSEKTKERWDKLKAERKANNTAYFNGYIKARQADEGKSNADKAWERTLGLDKQGLDQYNATIKHRDDREAIVDKRYDDDQEYKKTRDALGDEWKQKEFDQREKQYGRQNALAWANHDLSVQTRKDNKDIQEKRIIATGAKNVRGKQIGFADGDGNQVVIYENIWKGSMQQVYDAIAADFTEMRAKDPNSAPRVPKSSSAANRDDFVKLNWHKSPKASQIMLSLSNLDPATMNSELNDSDDDFSQYKQE